MQTMRSQISHWAPQVWRWTPLALMVLAAALVYASGANRYISFETLRAQHDMLKTFVAEHYWLSLAAYLALFSFTSSLAIPGGVFLQLAAGFLFGAAIGGSLTAMGETFGATVIYFATRTAFGDMLRARVAKTGGVAERWTDGLHRHAFWYLLSLRLPPVVPFVLVNIVSGVVAVPLRAYIPATLIGAWPSAVVFGWVGMGLDKVFERGDPLNLWSPWVVGPMIGLTVLSLAPFAFRMVLHRRAAAA